MVALLLQMMLEEGGHEVVPVSTPQEALRCLLAEANRLSLLVTDINLQADMTGYDVAAAARRQRPDLPVIYVSGDSGYRWKDEGVAGSRLIPKPFCEDELLTEVASLVG